MSLPPTIFSHVPLGTLIQALASWSFFEVPAQDEDVVWQSGALREQLGQRPHSLLGFGAIWRLVGVVPALHLAAGERLDDQARRGAARSGHWR